VERFKNQGRKPKDHQIIILEGFIMGRPAKSAEKTETKQDTTKSMSKEEQVGFHKGSLSTLSKERQELARILQIIEQLMQMHLAALKDLGVDLEKDSAGMPREDAPVKKPEKPIEDLL
jgi:hypothetical protein